MTRRRTLDPDDARRLRAIMRPIIAARSAALWKAEPAARAFDDPEGVHDMRVASRRLRAALDASRDLYPAPWFARLRDTVKTLTRALGDVRDADVMLAVLGEKHASVPGVDRLMTRVTQDRDAARVRLLALLDELAGRGVREKALRRFGDETKLPQVRKRDARRLVATRATAFLALAGDLPAAGEAAALHDLRIAAKRLRYTLQMVDAAFGEPGKETLDRLTTLQDQLGEIHNLDVLLDLAGTGLHALTDEALASAAAGSPAPDAATAAGLMALVADASRERQQHYDAAAAAWATHHEHLNEDIRALAGIKKGHGHA